jgi:hypothetical protein
LELIALLFTLSPPPHQVKEPLPDSDVKTFLKTLHREEVEFMIIKRLAAVLHARKRL